MRVLVKAHSSRIPAGFLFYDWLISFGDEVSLIWLSKNRRTIASIVYAFIRYTPIIDALMCVVSINALAMPVRLSSS